MARPFISVVLPVRNEERFIADTLTQLQRQRYPADRVEFLVCDGRSDDRTREIVSAMAEQDARIRLLDNPGKRSSAGRNVGFRAARGDFVLVVDGHVRLPDDRLLEAVAECFERSGADALGRPQPLIAGDGGPWAEAVVAARSSRLGHSPDSLIYGSAEGFAPAASFGAAYRREVFERVGYVDESFDACEDLEFNRRLDEAGLRCYASPRLTVQYFARDSLAGLFRQQFRYGFGRYKYLRKHPSALSLGQLAPPALTAAAVVAPPLVWFAPTLALLDAALLGVYALAVTAASAQIGLRRGFGLFWRCLAVFPAIHFGLGCGFWASLFRGGKLD